MIDADNKQRISLFQKIRSGFANALLALLVGAAATALCFACYKVWFTYREHGHQWQTDVWKYNDCVVERPDPGLPCSSIFHCAGNQSFAITLEGTLCITSFSPGKACYLAVERKQLISTVQFAVVEILVWIPALLFTAVCLMCGVGVVVALFSFILFRGSGPGGGSFVS